MKRKSAILVKTERDDDLNDEPKESTQQVFQPKDASTHVNNPRGTRNGNREIVKRIVETSRAHQNKFPTVVPNSATSIAIGLVRGRRTIDLPQTKTRTGSVGTSAGIQAKAAEPVMESLRTRARPIQTQNSTAVKRQPVKIVEEVATKVSAVISKWSASEL